jgi:ankyrin repeat protein
MKNIKTYTGVLSGRLYQKATEQERANRNLLDAAEKGNLEEVKRLLDKGAEVDARDIGDWTPLHLAADKGHTDVVRLLLDRGADVEASTDRGRTPLHHAITEGHTDVATVLLDRGADIDATDDDGQSPLDLAIFIRNIDVARFLILHGADALKAFSSPDWVLRFFKGDIDWMPEGGLKAKIKRMQRGKSAFGM